MAVIRLKRGTAAEWTSAKPVLKAGEPGFETDTGKLKIGNGINNWLTLPYVSSDSASGWDGGTSEDGEVVIYFDLGGA